MNQIVIRKAILDVVDGFLVAHHLYFSDCTSFDLKLLQ